MTQEEKQLLLKDLCARLPYGVQIHIDFNEIGHIVGDATLNAITSITGQFFSFTDFEQDFKNGDYCPISGFGSNKLLHLEEFKPYLRPMSSMTEEEEIEYNIAIDNDIEPERIVDWYYAHHLDFRGLIRMGLALEAPEEMYKIESL